MPAFVLLILQIIPLLLATSRDVIGFVTETEQMIRKMQAENRDPNDDEWAKLNDLVAGLRKELHAGE